MIGNDLVDLKRALRESNWHRKGYLEKLFTVEEQYIISEAADPDRMVWLLWTMKEASYKIHFRKHLVRTYQPQKIRCQHLFMDADSAQGYVRYGEQYYFSRSILNADFVHTVSVSKAEDWNHTQVLIGSSGEGNYREFLKNNDLPECDIIKNPHHLPYLLNRLTGQKRPVSISHHGRFMSLVYGTKTNLAVVCQ